MILPDEFRLTVLMDNAYRFGELGVKSCYIYAELHFDSQLKVMRARDKA